ncbi:MAG: CoA pyrophosphatase [Chitinophagales bacterium]|nr:CoA pyrophosphatase [Chitinophagales bacterium]OJV25221.1 MAG: hypothetical protein BGO32_04610 [Bacteroidetes bacterium 37-13]HRN95453.1 CoA pyrophosphatase [Chitinophagales bacterium]HRP39377.1 CoA pyrophosphatase [Chitinophagales bacterium]
MAIENFSPFINCIFEQLKRNLPGEDVQYKMAPYRQRLDKSAIAAMNPRHSGVLMLLYEKNNNWFTVFTQRKKYAGVHSGQMSFPGGKLEAGDENLIATSLRETEEEVGIPQKKVEILGLLSELYIPPSNFLVQPVVGYLKESIPFKAQENEVEKIVEIPLSFFKNDNNIKQIKMQLGNSMYTTVPAFVYQEHIIWGATAIVLSEFREVCKLAGV